MNLAELFNLSLDSSASRVGLEFEDTEYTFADLEDHSNRFANTLTRDGFEPGDRIAVYLKNSPTLIVAYLAAVKLGLIFVPVNVLYRQREIAHIAQDALPKSLITSHDLESHIRPCLNVLEGPRLFHADDLPVMTRDGPSKRPRCPVGGDSPAAIVYTSGTTGRSKGAVLTHNNFAANAANLVTCWHMSAADRLLLTLPLFHVHGLGNGIHTWLACGFRMRLLERFSKETIVQEFLKFRPTVFFGVPTMYERLIELRRETAREIGSFMRLFVSGSGPLRARTLERFHELYGHVILERYGMTETLMNTSNPYAGERRPGSVGKPLPGVSIRLADPLSGRDVPDGEVGEILVKGPNVFSGYWKQKKASTRAFTGDGYFGSGDLAVRSPDGYYTLQGRRTELIISSGFNIYPQEVEELLLELPEVAEAAVVGKPDPVRGEVPVAYVVPVGGQALDGEAVRACCRENLASFKVPQQIIVVKHLPRNALGKLQRHLLPAIKA